MGWARGSELADTIWGIVSKHIPDDKKQEVARKIINEFESYDCDTMYECEELQNAAKDKPPTEGPELREAGSFPQCCMLCCEFDRMNVGDTSDGFCQRYKRHVDFDSICDDFASLALAGGK